MTVPLLALLLSAPQAVLPAGIERSLLRSRRLSKLQARAGSQVSGVALGGSARWCGAPPLAVLSSRRRHVRRRRLLCSPSSSVPSLQPGRAAPYTVFQSLRVSERADGEAPPSPPPAAGGTGGRFVEESQDPRRPARCETRTSSHIYIWRWAATLPTRHRNHDAPPVVVSCTDVVDDEEDEDWKNWGKTNPKPKPAQRSKMDISAKKMACIQCRYPQYEIQRHMTI